MASKPYKKAIFFTAVAIVAGILLTFAKIAEPVATQPFSQPAEPADAFSAPVVANDTPVQRHGQLGIQDGVLVDAYGSEIQLRGMSSHGLAWFPEFTSRPTMETLRDYGANVFRIAMYSAENDGYATHPEENKALMYEAVQNALGCGLYTIVDWHIRKDKNPLTNLENALAFFEEFAARYAGNEGILYEICNEPGPDVPWEDVVGYASQVIPVIRRYSPDAIIIVGTPNMCSDFSSVVLGPIAFDNLMYTYHYYSDHADFQQEVDLALDAGLAVFITEWGVSLAEETGEVQWHLADAFDRYVQQRKLSWTNWSLSDKDEIYSAILPDLRKFSGWTLDDLTPSGRYFFTRFAGG